MAQLAVLRHSAQDISEKGRGENRAMIFCNSKKMCQQLEDGLNRARVRCDSIHGDKDINAPADEPSLSAGTCKFHCLKSFTGGFFVGYIILFKFKPVRVADEP